MAPYIDYAQLKEKVSLEQGAHYLGLDLKTSGKQLRGICPACNSDNPRALALTPEKNLFYCFSAEIGGDVVRLVAHIKGIKQLEAAQELTDHFDRKVTAPQKTTGRTVKSQPATFDPERFWANCVYTEELAQAGISEADAARVLIGYHSRYKKHYLGSRNPDGSISGFTALTDLSAVKFPPQWMVSNVVALRKKA